MKTHFLSRLLTQPWHIHEARGRTIIAAILATLRGERPAEDICGDPLPKMQIMGDVAVIPIAGTLMLNVPDWIKAYGFGLTDANDIEQELAQAVNDPAVSFIVLTFDSPGGESHAGAKLFDLVEAANRKKQVYSYCGDGEEICSAAFNAASPSVAILTAKYATVGCIGTYLAIMDDSEYWKLMGITWEVFRSGELKGIGEDGITDSQKAFLQNLVDSWGQRFRRNVSKYRTGIAAEDMQGQWFNGDEAATRGFTAGVVKDFPSALKKFRGLAGV